MKGGLNKIKMAKSKTSTGVTIILTVLVVLVVVGGIIGLVAVFSPKTLQTTFPSQTTGPNQTSSNGGNTIVTTNPTIAFVAQQAQNIGTTVTAAYQVAVNANTGFGAVTASGTGTAVPGQTDNFLINATGYHSAPIYNVLITPSIFPYTLQLNKNASVTEVVFYPYSGLNIVNAGGVSSGNITNIGSNGAAYQLNDNMYGTTQTSTQDMLCLVEVTDGVNVTSTGAQLTGTGVVPDSQYTNSIPAWYTPAGVNSRVWGFDVPAITSSTATPLTLTIQTLTTKSMVLGDKVIKTCYTKEYIVDSKTGQITYEVADSQTNAVGSLGKYVFTGVFGTA